jgi:hypothetical protein
MGRGTVEAAVQVGVAPARDDVHVTPALTSSTRRMQEQIESSSDAGLAPTMYGLTA